jgi:hypothetical protein
LRGLHRWAAAGLLLLAAAAPSLAGGEPDLDLQADSDLYPLLRRSETRAGSLIPSSSLPVRYSLLESLLESRPANPADAAQAGRFIPSRRGEAVAWVAPDSANSFYLSPRAEAGYTWRDRADSSGTAWLGGVGMEIHGRFGRRLSFYSQGLAYTEATDRAQFSHQFDPSQGETYSVEKGAGDSLLSDRTFNRYTAYALLDLPGIAIKAGRDRVHSGPGYFSSLTAERDTPPYWMAEARIDFAPWLGVRDYLLAMTDTDHAIRKYANLHRFEFRPLAGLEVAFQDIVIYQDRDPDWRYALPLAPLTFTEADEGGRDNAAMGFDFLYAGIRDLSVWGELFIDDLLGPSAFFDDFWENRWAALAGFQATSPLPWLDADLVVEWSHVEPWTYVGRQPQTSFRHFNVPSASKLGPDSRSLDIQLSYRPAARLEFRSRFEADDKGIGRQATLGVVHDDAIDGTSKRFLAGSVRSRRQWTQEIRFIASRYLDGRAGWGHDFGDAARDEITVGVDAGW